MRWAASDVSPSSHLAFHTPNTCRVLFVLCCVLGLGCLLLCGVFVSCFASVLESRILRAVQTSMTDKALSLARLCSKKKPPGVLHMSALGRFGRFTLFSPRFTFQTLAVSFLFCVVFWVWGFCCFVVFLFPVLQVFWNPEFSAQFRPR